MRLHRLLVPCAALAATLASHGAGAAISFNRDIRPILSDKCYYCHGPDKNHRKGKMRLDIREEALAKEAFVPGKPGESELVRRITTTNEDDMMPPAEARKTLAAAQKELLKRWIAEGAKYEPHWAFITPVRPPLPRLARKSKIANPIDVFILAELEAKKISPSPEASRRTLLRRLSLDLTGLPPMPEEIASFEKDKSPQAYERQVDRLLASPHYGERMAVPWLDVVRFADTVGYHGDQNVNVFPYRDYVINAFNSNKPFDQFTIEQLAGDLLPNPTVEQRVATGFNRLNMVTREGGAQPGEYLAKYGADRARTVGMAWLGLTVGCAECHDHKFDPILTRDFYSLKAFFADVKQWGVYQDYKYTPNPDLKNWSNDHPFPPEEVVDSPYLHQRIEKLRAQISELANTTFQKADEKQRAQFAEWRENAAATLQNSPDGWLQPRPFPLVLTNIIFTTNKTKLTNILAALEATSETVTNVTNLITINTNVMVWTDFEALADGSLLFEDTNRPSTPISLKLDAGWLSALRLEILPHEQHAGTIFRGDHKSAAVQISATLRRAGEKKETKIAFYHADADHQEPRYANGFEIIGIKDTWRVERDLAKKKQTGVWLLDPPLLAKTGDTLLITLKTNVLGCLRVSVTPLVPTGGSRDEEAPCGKVDQSLLKPAVVPTCWLASTAPDSNAFGEYKKLEHAILECRGGKSPTLVTVSMKPDITRVLPRGNWQSEAGDIVEPLPPHFLPPPRREVTNRLTRLDLANWLVAPDNPLTPRVIMNRLWKQFYGTGLANPLDDFGSQGEPPSHPELLDWLAVEFRDSGWDIKHMVRLMVTSTTYRQSANLRPELHEIDPNNRLLASQNPRRLEAEFVRDNALAIAGLLNLDLGGPSAFPYQPGGYYENLQFPDRKYEPDEDDQQYRRGIYTHWQRTFLHPMLANFDAPAREECIASRTVSNTPQQALTLLNNPTFVEAARVWAAKLLQSSARSDNARLDLAYEQALGRPVKRSERISLKAFLSAQRQHLTEDQDETKKIETVGQAPATKGLDETELGAWTSVCRVILNLQETITRY